MLCDRDPVAPEGMLAITGAGGHGALTTAQILLAALGRAGVHGLLMRAAGPQIRGGESAATLRFASRPVACMADRLDLLLGLDWANVERFVDELPVDADTLILQDVASAPPPPCLTECGARVRALPLAARAAEIPGGRANMVALGAIGGWLGLSHAVLSAASARVLASKDAATRAAAIACLDAGLGLVEQGGCRPVGGAAGLWNLSGNEAAGLGALRAGVRFVAAYPITPATELLEWLAPRLPQRDGQLLQAEDELAAVNMVIGASFGGAAALTATSGPGLSLMVEGLGLAVASETPLVVVDVQRGGPSTGIPTKTEQSDLGLALYGLHGDAPHLVLAPLGIADCCFTLEWAVGLAEHLQTVAIVLSDQALGQSRAIVDPPPRAPQLPPRLVPDGPLDAPFQRYAPSVDGRSPMPAPGQSGCRYVAEGLEHDASGTPSSLAADHRQQLDKRARKLDGLDPGPDWAEIRGRGTRCLVTWGSSAGAVFEAAARLTAAGRPTRVIALRLIAPLARAALREALDGAARIWVVELNQDGQLFAHLHAQRVLPPPARALARPGPLAWRPGEIVAAVLDAEETDD
ncbi:2-oxoacid:acceptor oxidoreductase family protein [Marichromatium gracile]|uniref:2-oxoacid:acceptor oxidoreductase family protein n=1 Tax=Marichromatium gracile TaxID=1048 RepID=UPI001F203047|nr:2-oxoacid:acceptor oxidoreductase family protein [Marichromatium gracile]MCF1184631.1 2-oxoacid:acceptor oxidoreductase family protein [Marichromatium gracile]